MAVESRMKRPKELTVRSVVPGFREEYKAFLNT
jgi:hypothetical protein